MINGRSPDPFGRITPAIAPGERISLRHRLADGSATDVIGWLDRLDPTSVALTGSDGSTVTVARPMIIAARRVPPAAGGPDPLRVPAETLQRIASAGWIDHVVPLGDWQVRIAEGFTRRANSALAIGDPGTGLLEAAARVIDFYAEHDLPPLAQVITDGPLDHALRDIGWRPGGPETELMVIKLSDLLDRAAPTGPDPIPTRPEPTPTLPEPFEGHLTLAEQPDEAWLAALAAQRGSTPDRLGPAARRVVAGDGRAVFATITGPESVGSLPTAIGRGHLAGSWFGVSGVWTHPDHRRRGHATAILLALAGGAARQGARYAYLQVERDNEPARLGYLRLGFRHHHDYSYLTPGA